ncbi:phage major capsid protein [Pseudomonas nitroreducens]|uniref:phage major capsid protein n=1 Tax=Pseudomonas nitroreducens TaxID=46680 RepID=UPI00265B497D|nr:phage major capsid protein [Pseudomonas nitroreducens]MCP1652749.1 HK97 family phage major capsid protein [Pseudomonas nitroreducens]
MKDLKDLKQQRANLASEMRSLNDSIGDAEWSGDQKGKWNEMRSAIKALDERIEREEELRNSEQRYIEERSDELADKARRDQGSLTTEERQSQAFARLLRVGASDLTGEEKRAIAELRAQSTGDMAKGGFTVPTTFLNRVYESMKDYGGLEAICQILNTESGNEISWPTSDGTNDEGILVGENEDAGEKDVDFDVETMGSHKMTSKVIRVSNELLQDSGIDMEGYLAGRIGSRLGRGRARLLIQGTGAGTPRQPKGLEAATGVGATTAAASKLGWKDVNGLIHSVDPSYRRAPNFRLLFNDATLQLLEEMEDAQGRPLWIPGLDASAPATILKHRYVVDQGVASIGAGKKFMFAGDFQQFVIRNVRAMAIRRLAERYAEFDQVGFLAFTRFGCVLQDRAAIKALDGKA